MPEPLEDRLGIAKVWGELRAGSYRRIPGFLRRGLIEPAASLVPESKTGRWPEKARRLRRFLAHAGDDRAARRSGWMRTTTAEEVAALTGGRLGEEAIEALVAAARNGADTEDAINQMLHADLRISLPGDMLVKVDRMSMAHGLEVGCSKLDRGVVDAALTMPGDWKLRAGPGKAVLRNAFSHLLPVEVLKRPKRGFEIPIAEWLTGPLRSMTEAAIAPVRLEAMGL